MIKAPAGSNVEATIFGEGSLVSSVDHDTVNLDLSEQAHARVSAKTLRVDGLEESSLQAIVRGGDCTLALYQPAGDNVAYKGTGQERGQFEVEGSFANVNVSIVTPHIRGKSEVRPGTRHEEATAPTVSPPPLSALRQQVRLVGTTMRISVTIAITRRIRGSMSRDLSRILGGCRARLRKGIAFWVQSRSANTHKLLKVQPLRGCSFSLPR